MVEGKESKTGDPISTFSKVCPDGSPALVRELAEHFNIVIYKGEGGDKKVDIWPLRAFCTEEFKEQINERVNFYKFLGMVFGYSSSNK